MGLLKLGTLRGTKTAKVRRATASFLYKSTPESWGEICAYCQERCRTFGDSLFSNFVSTLFHSHEGRTPVHVQSGFHLSVTTLNNLLEYCHPIEVKQKGICTRLHTFSRALGQLHVLTSSFDWFTVLSAHLRLARVITLVPPAWQRLRVVLK